MRPGLKPKVHLFVCENRREGSELGPGCGAAGEQVTKQLKGAIMASGLVSAVWVTRTHCIGLCPPRGTAVAFYPKGQIFTEVLPEDCPYLLELARKEAIA
jgi:(2Fe-2S) ferredoxin